MESTKQNMNKEKSEINNSPQSHINAYQQKMIDMVNQIKIGSIILTCNIDKAIYYKVTNIIDGCTEPVMARQFKTIEMEYIGTRSEAAEYLNDTIYYYDDIFPYAQMIIK